MAVAQRPLVGRHEPLWALDECGRVARRRDDPAGDSGRNLDEVLPWGRQREAAHRDRGDRLEGEIDEPHDGDGPRENKQRCPTGVQLVRCIETRWNTDQRQQCLNKALMFKPPEWNRVEPEQPKADPGGRGCRSGGLHALRSGPTPVPLYPASDRKQQHDNPDQEIGQQPHGKQLVAQPHDGGIAHTLRKEIDS